MSVKRLAGSSVIKFTGIQEYEWNRLRDLIQSQDEPSVLVWTTQELPGRTEIATTDEEYVGQFWASYDYDSGVMAIDHKVLQYYIIGSQEGNITQYPMTSEIRGWLNDFRTYLRKQLRSGGIWLK